MKIIYTQQAKNQLLNIKDYISKDSKTIANNYLSKIKNKIEILSSYPYIGKINTTLFDSFKKEADANSFTLSPTIWVEDEK